MRGESETSLIDRVVRYALYPHCISVSLYNSSELVFDNNIVIVYNTQLCVGGKLHTICSMQIYKEWQYTPTDCTAKLNRWRCIHIGHKTRWYVA